MRLLFIFTSFVACGALASSVESSNTKITSRNLERREWTVKGCVLGCWSELLGIYPEAFIGTECQRICSEEKWRRTQLKWQLEAQNKQKQAQSEHTQGEDASGEKPTRVEAIKQ